MFREKYLKHLSEVQRKVIRSSDFMKEVWKERRTKFTRDFQHKEKSFQH